MLYCPHNSISELNLNHRLEILDIGSNEFIDLPRGLLYIDLTYNELQNFHQGLRNFTDDIDDVKYTLKINHNPFIRKDKSLQMYETFIKDRSNTDMNHDFTPLEI